MPATWVLDEGKWDKAKEIAAKEGRDGDYDYITGIYKQMGGRIKGAAKDPKPAKTARKDVRKAGPGEGDLGMGVDMDLTKSLLIADVEYWRSSQ